MSFLQNYIVCDKTSRTQHPALGLRLKLASFVVFRHGAEICTSQGQRLGKYGRCPEITRCSWSVRNCIIGNHPTKGFCEI